MTYNVCSSRLLMFLDSLYCKQYGPSSDCSLWSSLIRVHIVWFSEKYSLMCIWIYAADLRCRRHFQDKNSGGMRVIFSRQLYVREKNNSFTAYWVTLYAFLSSADFSKLTFKKNLSGIPSECQTVWLQIRPDLLSDLIWVQTVRKVCQQTTLGSVNDQQMTLCSGEEYHLNGILFSRIGTKLNSN